MRLLFVDTETSGRLPRGEHFTSPNQPHLLQLGAILTDEDGNELDTYAHLIRPDGWEIEPGAMSAHGITMERALHEGAPLQRVLERFTEMTPEAEVFVAHNVGFDATIISASYHRIGSPNPLQGMETYCTMKESTNIVRLPKFGTRGFKWPKLEESYKFFIGKDLEGAHDALVDVRACKDVFFAIMSRE